MKKEDKDKDRLTQKYIDKSFCGFVVAVVLVVVVGWIVEPGAAVESHAYFSRYPVDRMTCSGRQPWVRPCATLDWTNVRNVTSSVFFLLLSCPILFLQVELVKFPVCDCKGHN